MSAIYIPDSDDDDEVQFVGDSEVQFVESRKRRRHISAAAPSVEPKPKPELEYEPYPRLTLEDLGIDADSGLPQTWSPEKDAILRTAIEQQFDRSNQLFKGRNEVLAADPDMHVIYDWDTLSPDEKAATRQLGATAHVLWQLYAGILEDPTVSASAWDVERFLNRHGWNKSKVLEDQDITVRSIARELSDYAERVRKENDECKKADSERQRRKEAFQAMSGLDKKRKMKEQDLVQLETDLEYFDPYEGIPNDKLFQAILKDSNPIRYNHFHEDTRTSYVLANTDIQKIVDMIIASRMKAREEREDGESLSGKGMCCNPVFHPALRELEQAKIAFAANPTNKTQSLVWTAQSRAAGLGLKV